MEHVDDKLNWENLKHWFIQNVQSQEISKSNRFFNSYFINL
jgi:hypothetical protein